MTIENVATAFDRLLALAATNTDTDTLWTIAAVREDIIDILTGCWHGDEPAAMTADDAPVGWSDVFAEERGVIR